MQNAKRAKGKSIVCFPADYISFDLETTGLSPQYDEIIEIGAVKIHNRCIADKFQTLVKPSIPVTQYVSELTGITNDMLATAPAIEDVIPAFRNFVGDSIIMGQNVSFDINFMYDSYTAFDGKPFENDYVDMLRISRKLYPDMPHHNLSSMTEKLNVPANNLHRALSDCVATAQCFEMMKVQVMSDYVDVNDFTKLFRIHGQTLHAKDLTATATDFDETHPIYGKHCVFTGTLERMPRREAMQIVLNLGGICEDRVTKNTNFLILGNNDYCPMIKDGKSSKQKKAEDYKLKGQDIEIIPENVFYDMLEE